MPKENSLEKKEQTKGEKTEIQPSRPQHRPPSMIEPYRTDELMRNFDRIFEDFRRDFEDLLWPSDRILSRAYSLLPGMSENIPLMDLEDRGKDFCLTVEVPGFKKEDLQIEVEDQAIDIRGSRSTKDTEKSEHYVRRERGFQSFHRRVELTEEINSGDVEASMNDGVLEIVMPKRNPKPKKKISVK